MSLTTGEMSPADMAAVMGNGTCGGFNDGAWWIIILFLFAFRGGYGFGGNGESGAQPNYVLTSDFAQVERKLDSITNGLCDGFYTQAQLINGVTGALATQGYETRNAITQAQIAEMQNANTITSAINNCCCNTREAIAGVNYNMSSNTRDILESNNANTRAILDAITANKLEAKNDRIAELERQLQFANFNASQVEQTSALTAQIRNCPIPAYVVPNPNCCYNGGGCGA